MRDWPAICIALDNFYYWLTIAEHQLAANAFLAGEHFSPADIQFGHILYRYFTLELARPAWPVIEAYYRRLSQRAAYQQHVMLDWSELKA